MLRVHIPKTPLQGLSGPAKRRVEPELAGVSGLGFRIYGLGFRV